MWALQEHNKELYAGILAAAFFLIFAGLGPGLWPKETVSFNSWQYLVFDTLCHQDPSRSYMISGIPMAVCARCLGIYSFFLVGWLAMPLVALIKKSSSWKTEKKWLIATILLNLADVLANFLDIWTNTLFTRFLLGGSFGLVLAYILTNEFFTINKNGV